MGLKLNATNGGGSVELDVPDTVNSDLTLTVPAQAGEIVAANTSGNLEFGGLTVSGSAASGSLNIKSDGYIEGLTHPLESGSSWRDEDSGSSLTATGWVTVASTTWESGLDTDYMSCTFNGYISGGTYYWTWKMYNATRSEDLIPFEGANRLSSTHNNIQFIGSVHASSRQPWMAFKKSTNTVAGDTISLQLHASNGGGTVLHTSSQVLYASDIAWHMGIATGGSSDF